MSPAATPEAICYSILHPLCAVRFSWTHNHAAAVDQPVPPLWPTPAASLLGLSALHQAQGQLSTSMHKCHLLQLLKHLLWPHYSAISYGKQIKICFGVFFSKMICSNLTLGFLLLPLCSFLGFTITPLLLTSH